MAQVKAEIIAKLKMAREQKKALGPRRQSHFEQREFLMDIATKFQDIIALAVRADYSRTDFFDEGLNLRLATECVNRGETFAQQMSDYGHEIEFSDAEGVKEIEELDLDDLSCEDSETIPTREVENHADVEDIVPGDDEVASPYCQDILGWLKAVYRSSRGFELGTFDSSLLATSMNRQAQKWRNFARGYIADVINLVHNFLMELLRYLIPDHRQVREGMAALLIDQLRNRYESALKHTDFLLAVELNGTPATYNDHFKETLNEWYSLRTPNPYDSH